MLESLEWSRLNLDVWGQWRRRARALVQQYCLQPVTNVRHSCVCPSCCITHAVPVLEQKEGQTQEGQEDGLAPDIMQQETCKPPRYAVAHQEDGVLQHTYAICMFACAGRICCLCFRKTLRLWQAVICRIQEVTLPCCLKAAALY